MVFYLAENTSFLNSQKRHARIQDTEITQKLQIDRSVPPHWVYLLANPGGGGGGIPLPAGG